MKSPSQQGKEAHPTSVLRKLGQMLRYFVESRWQLPMGAATVLSIGAAVMSAAAELSLMSDGSPRWIEYTFNIGIALFLVGVLGGLMVPLWLVIMTAVWIHREDLWEAVCCWAASAAAAAIAYLVAFWLAYGMPHDAPLLRSDDYNVPEHENRMKI